MSVHYQFGYGYGTAAQIAAYTPSINVPFEPVWDTTNGRLVIMTGALGAFVPCATEAYVQTQVASIAAGSAVNLTNWLFCR